MNPDNSSIHHHYWTACAIGLVLLFVFLFATDPTFHTTIVKAFAPAMQNASLGLLTADTQAQVSASAGNTGAGTEGDTLVGQPTVSIGFINAVLASYHSPAAGTGQALYDLGQQYHIDPVYALAFFMHESSFGTAGMARYTHSLGNLRCLVDIPCSSGYAYFASWYDGYKAWYHLIGMLYMAQWGKYTVEQIIPTYAPSGDHNNVSAYIAAINHAVATWRSGTVEVS